MDVEAVKALCRSFPGAKEQLAADPANVLSFKVRDKNFAYFKTSEPEQWRFSIRVTAERFLELTDQPGVKPARYMHRFHWVTIVNVAGFHEAYLKALIEWSYRKSVAGLAKKYQREYLSEMEQWQS